MGKGNGRPGGLSSCGPSPAVSAVPASIPDAAEIYSRATEIAKERYPNGCANATILARIVGEAIRSLAPHLSYAPAIRPNRHNRLDFLPEDQRLEAIRICTETTLIHSEPGSPPCTDLGHVCYRCQDHAAQAIEARRAETAKQGSVVDESAVRQDAPNG